MTDNTRKVEVLRALRDDLARDRLTYWTLTMAIDAYTGASDEEMEITKWILDCLLDDALDAEVS